MSGFCGAVDFSGSRPVTRELIEKMVAALAHRGPDGSDLYIAEDGSYGVGHLLLALKEPPGKLREPIFDREGKVCVVTDGWVSNYDELRGELEGMGCKFRSNLDAELILELYLERDTDFAEAIDGAACAAIYDSRRKRFILVRDRMGVKSICYAERNGCVVFGSEAKALFAHPAVKRECEPLALMDFLGVRHRPAPLTMFKDIRKVRNSEVVTFVASGRRQERQYWTPLTGELIRNRDEAFFVEGIRDRFRHAVKSHMATYRKVGVLLSGGLDSSSVVAVMSEFAGEPIHTFSIGFKRGRDDKPDGLNELAYARKVAEHFGTKHHESWMYGDDILPVFNEVIGHMEDVGNASEQVMLLPLLKSVREVDVPLVLTGEGGIEEYMGSNSYMLTFNALRGKWAMIQSLPLFVRKLVSWAAERLKFDRMDVECYSYAREWLWLLSQGRRPFIMESVVMNEKFLQGIMGKDFLRDHAGISPYRFWDAIYGEIYRTIPNPGLMQEFAYCDWRTLVSDILNMEADKLGAACGVDVRAAIDPLLAEFLFRIPGEVKVAGGEAKRLFKRAMDGPLPHDIVYREKAGFSSAMVNILRSICPGALRREVGASTLKDAGYLNMTRIKEIIEQHELGRVDHTWVLFALLMLFIWYRHWIEGRD